MKFAKLVTYITKLDSTQMGSITTIEAMQKKTNSRPKLPAYL